jgi:hypothetical protein
MNAFYYLGFYSKIGCEKVEIKVKLQTRFKTSHELKRRNVNRKQDPEQEKAIVYSLKKRIY